MKKALITFLVLFYGIGTFACDCGTWGQLLVRVPAGSNRYDCGSTIEWNCSQPFSFTTIYRCTPNDASCQAKIKWEVRSAAGAIIKSGMTSNNISNGFNLPSGGNYTLTLNASCNGKSCNPCIYKIIANCSSACECGSWGQLLVRIPAGSARYNCFSQIPWKTNQPFSFTSTYQCSPNSESCKAISTWVVKTTSGSVIKSGTGTNQLNGGFNLPANGIYILAFTARCNGAICKSCDYKIVVQ